jgi:hypothetical protein
VRTPSEQQYKIVRAGLSRPETAMKTAHPGPTFNQDLVPWVGASRRMRDYHETASAWQPMNSE